MLHSSLTPAYFRQFVLSPPDTFATCYCVLCCVEMVQAVPPTCDGRCVRAILLHSTIAVPFLGNGVVPVLHSGPARAYFRHLVLLYCVLRGPRGRNITSANMVCTFQRASFPLLPSFCGAPCAMTPVLGSGAHVLDNVGDLMRRLVARIHVVRQVHRCFSSTLTFFSYT